MQEAICSGNIAVLRERLNTLLRTSVSYYDTAKENFYHGLMLGLLAMTDSHYEAKSNRESGDGRYDICLVPKQNNLPGILIELKAEKKCTAAELKGLAENALKQISAKRYDAPLQEFGMKNIIIYGVAFSGKNVEIAMKQVKDGKIV